MMVSVRDLVEARLYASEQEAIDDALRHLLRARPNLRVQLAVHRYQHEPISVAKGADQAGVSWEEMRDILVEQGVAPRLGPETVEDAEQEVAVLREHFAARH